MLLLLTIRRQVEDAEQIRGSRNVARISCSRWYSIRQPSWRRSSLSSQWQTRLRWGMLLLMLWMSKEEKLEFQRELLEIDDVSKIPTLDDLIWLAFDTVWLMYYFTTGEKETKAWTIKKWSTAPQAAGAIHTDFERWFIKAEVINYDEFVELWSRPKAKEKWKVRLEWKDYIVQDWDIMIFKFNV